MEAPLAGTMVLVALLAEARKKREGLAVRVLVVEDQSRLAEAIRRGLVAEGFAVDVASDGERGVNLAQTIPYDAIILDILLPILNGFEVCRTLRQAKIWTPILMLTALTGEADEVKALDTGADDFLAKPFSYSVLVARLRALLRRGVRERPSVLRAGDLCLDPAAHVCMRGDQVIELTPREMAMLDLLMRHAGQVLSKADILDHVWDIDYDGDDNIVEVYVRYLRRKIDLPFGRQGIETVRGAGYRLAVDGG